MIILRLENTNSSGSINDKDREVEFKEILPTNRAYQANKNMLTSGNLSKKTELKIHKTLSVTMHAAANMTMTKKDNMWAN